MKLTIARISSRVRLPWALPGKTPSQLSAALLRRGRTPYHLTDLSRWAGAAIDEMLSALLERITVGRAPGR
jgi:hypothetical protein